MSTWKPCEQNKAVSSLLLTSKGPWHPQTLMTDQLPPLPWRINPPCSSWGDVNPFSGWRARMDGTISELQGKLEVKPRFEGGGGCERDPGSHVMWATSWRGRRSPCPLLSPGLGLGEILQLSDQPHGGVWFTMAQPPAPYQGNFWVFYGQAVHQQDSLCLQGTCPWEAPPLCIHRDFPPSEQAEKHPV